MPAIQSPLVHALKKEISTKYDFDDFLVVHHEQLLTHSFPDDAIPLQLASVVGETLNGYRKSQREIESLLIETITLTILLVAQSEGWIGVLLPHKPKQLEDLIDQLLDTMNHYPSFFSNKSPLSLAGATTAPAIKLRVQS